AGALEGEVLGALWAAGSPLTPSQLQNALGTGLAYNTIHTILTRLQDKGLVVRVRQGGRSGYQPAKDAAQDAADRMRSGLGVARARPECLQRSVPSLGPADGRARRAALGGAAPA